MTQSVEQHQLSKQGNQFPLALIRETAADYVASIEKRKSVITRAVADLFRALEIPAAQKISAVRRSHHFSKTISPEELLFLLDSSSHQEESEQHIFDRFVDNLAENGALDEATLIDVFYHFFYTKTFHDDFTIKYVIEHIGKAIQRREARELIQSSSNQK